MAVFIQFVIGLVFGTGLIVAGMSDPAKVLNFLDFAAIPSGTWDASLAFVLGGAVIVAALGFRLVLRRENPVYGQTFHLPTARDIDARIILGPALFGIGWGLAGFCPGPALTALGGGGTSAATFVISMSAGMIVARWLSDRRTASPALAGV